MFYTGTKRLNHKKNYFGGVVYVVKLPTNQP